LQNLRVYCPYYGYWIYFDSVSYHTIDFDQLPGVIALVFKSAFNMEAGFGAVFGLAIQWGVKRGIYSNEAGQVPYILLQLQMFHIH
jgi:Na+/alanine symporter